MNPSEEIAALEALIDELLTGIQNVFQSKEELSDEFQGVLARELDWAINRIEELRKENPVEELPSGNQAGASQTPNLDPGPYPSSNVNSFKYDPKSEKLWVKFHGTDSADSGPTYQYENIPRNIYDLFSKGRVAPRTSGQNRYHRWIKGVTPSLGASLYALIREGGYPYNRVN